MCQISEEAETKGVDIGLLWSVFEVSPEPVINPNVFTMTLNLSFGYSFNVDVTWSETIADAVNNFGPMEGSM